MGINNTMQGKYLAGQRLENTKKAKWKMGMRQGDMDRVALKQKGPQGVTLLWSREHRINVWSLAISSNTETSHTLRTRPSVGLAENLQMALNTAVWV